MVGISLYALGDATKFQIPTYSWDFVMDTAVHIRVVENYAVDQAA